MHHWRAGRCPRVQGPQWRQLQLHDPALGEHFAADTTASLRPDAPVTKIDLVPKLNTKARKSENTKSELRATKQVFRVFVLSCLIWAIGRARRRGHVTSSGASRKTSAWPSRPFLRPCR